MFRKRLPAIHGSELEYINPVSVRKMWAQKHRVGILIVLGVILLAAIFFGIRWYVNYSHPLTKFMNASAKDFNSSFRFDTVAQKNGETVMHFTGAYEADPSKQNLKAVYDADYGDYTYTGAVYAEDSTCVSGNYYEGKWRVRDCTEKVLNFFDFNTDYKKGRFDGASFLRFTDLTSSYSAGELERFMKLFKEQMGGNTDLAALEITSDDSGKTYTYTVSTAEFFDMVRDKGASIFFSSIEYDAFCHLYEHNESVVSDSDCTLSYTINSAGYMTALELSLTAGGEEFAVRTGMTDCGSTKVDVPLEFIEAATGI